MCFFCSVNACAYMCMIQFEQLVKRGLLPLKSESDIGNASIDWIPGMKNIRLKDLPTSYLSFDPNDSTFNFSKDEAQAVFQATAIIINTFNELEAPVLDEMSAMLPPIYTIGPTLLHHQITNNSLKTVGSNLWKEDSDCLKCLNDKVHDSVIYMNFGTGSVLTNKQVVEFAWGLANSGHDFLWVIRPDIVNGDSAILPAEFLNEIDGRGFLASWCPQEEVLMQPSVGFLTHCDWNSLSAGVPMICCPCSADRKTNFGICAPNGGLDWRLITM